jgi:GTP-binding protein
LEDAHKGVGLGHDFLRHIERARVLVVVVDMAGGDGRKPWEDHACLLRELGMHNRELLERPRLVVANKMDLPESAANLKTFRTRCKVRPLSFSALTGDGLPRLRDELRRLTGAAAEE